MRADGTWEPVSADVPWHMSARGSVGPKPSTSDGLRFMGWTLVDCGGWRWAAKGPERIRVCREGEDKGRACELFRQKVREREKDDG